MKNSKNFFLSKQLKGLSIRIIFYYFILLGLAYFFQDKLLYQSKKIDHEKFLQYASERYLEPWPSTTKDYRAFQLSTHNFDFKGTIIVFHGNAGTALDRDYYALLLTKLGYRVLLAEYPSYASRQGNASEQSFVEDAIKTTKLAYEAFGKPLFLLGESLGAGVVSGVVAEGSVPVNGIALITPWDTLPNVVQKKFWYFPARLLVKDKYNNISNLSKYDGPVAVTLAKGDNVIPSELAANLYNALDNPKRLWEFSESGHNSLPFDTKEGMGWLSDMMSFLEGKYIVPTSTLSKSGKA